MQEVCLSRLRIKTIELYWYVIYKGGGYVNE